MLSKFYSTLLVFLSSIPLICLSQTPSHSYAPIRTQCPSGSFMRYSGTVERGNQRLGDKEANYIEQRRQKVTPGAYRAYLSNVENSLRSQSSRLPPYVSKILRGDQIDRPRASVAVSGGGLRASYFGAGVLNALDGRNSTSVKAGTGGLLQALDYTTGLSGAACLTMSLAQANFPDMYELTLGPRDPRTVPEESDAAIGSNKGWLTDLSYITPGALNVVEDGLWWSEISGDVEEKAAAGFKVTLADMYARMLAYHFVNGTNRENYFDPAGPHGQAETLSSLARTVPTLRNYSQPLALITSMAESPGEGRDNILQGAAVPLTNNQYEFSMFEVGSWDPNLATFIDTAYLGSQPGSKYCVQNYDNLGFMIAASANVLKKADNLLGALSTKGYFPILPRLEGFLSLIPNPFKGLGTDEYLDQNSEYLGLFDGEFGGENLPFAPLIVPARKVDVILALDASDDLDMGYPNGDALLATAKRSRLLPPKAYPFPDLKDVSRLNLTRPSFVGCTDSPGTPLIIYIPNGPPVPKVQTAALQLSRAISTAVLDSSTQLAFTKDPLWSGCLACAVVDRARARAKERRVGLCADCFARYCYDGQ
ncbi:lysophospholipase [Melampsora americana]|nr:lysophospholipase [Melampsora americana]